MSNPGLVYWRIHRLRSRRALALASFDVSAWVVGFVAMSYLLHLVSTFDQPINHAALGGLTSGALYVLVGIPVHLHQGRAAVGSFDDSVLVSTVAGLAGLLMIGAELAWGPWYSTVTAVAAPLAALLVMLAGRGAYRIQRERMQYLPAVHQQDREPVVVLGAGENARLLVGSMLRDPRRRWLPVALLDDDPLRRHLRIRNVPVVGRLDDLPATAARLGATTAVMAIANASTGLLRQLDALASPRGITLKVLPSFRILLDLPGDGAVHRLQPAEQPPRLPPSLTFDLPGARWQRTLKRSIDVALALVIGTVTLPVLIVLALLVLLETPGPILYSQVRIGRHGKRFLMHKFRTMRLGATGPMVTSATDVRVTRVGNWLRLFKLDELPQLLNVLKGDMSFVGPRPEVPVFVEQWTRQCQQTILSVRPGITCTASIEFRNEAELMSRAVNAHEYYFHVLAPAKNALSVAYVKGWSLRQDFKILWQTGAALLDRRRLPDALVFNEAAPYDDRESVAQGLGDVRGEAEPTSLQEL